MTDSKLTRRGIEAWFRARARYHLARMEQISASRSQLRILLGLLNRAQSTHFGIHHDFRRIRRKEDFHRLVPLRTIVDQWRSFWTPSFPRLGGIGSALPPRGPVLEGTTWPGPVTHLLTADQVPDNLICVGRKEFRGTVPEAAWAVALSPELQQAQRQAFFTTLSLVSTARPRASLLSGSFLFLREGRMVATKEGNQSFKRMAAASLPAWLRPYAVTAPADEDLLEPLVQYFLRGPAQGGERSPLTCLAGPLPQLVAFLKRALQMSGSNSASEIWPGLCCVLYGKDWDNRMRNERQHFAPGGRRGLSPPFSNGGTFHSRGPAARPKDSRCARNKPEGAAEAELRPPVNPPGSPVFEERGSERLSYQPSDLRELVGSDVLMLETVFRPEGPVAVEDPRQQMLRILPNHGVYFEFVPCSELDQPDLGGAGGLSSPVALQFRGERRPTRHSLDEVEVGVPYELAITSPAGWWACRTGLTLRFESRDPALIRLVPRTPEEKRSTDIQLPPHSSSRSVQALC